MQTEFLTTNAARVQRWSGKIWLEMPREIYFGKFMKDDINAIIEVRRDLEGGPGDVLTYSLGNKLDGQGVSGDDPLEGQEEELLVYSDTVTINQRRNAVRLKGKLSEQRTAFDQQPLARTMLKTWLAEVIDDDIFSKLTTASTTVVFGGSATSTATLVATGLITPAKIDTAVAKAQKADPKIWPVMVDGNPYYVLCLHTDVGFDLRNNGVWQGYQQNGAQVQGKDNPIFSGMFNIYNGVVIHTHEKVPVATNGGAAGDVAYASNLFLGRQAGLMAWGAKPQAWTKEFEYGNSIGMAIGAMWGFRKALFNALDHAVIELRMARTNN